MVADLLVYLNQSIVTEACLNLEQTSQMVELALHNDAKQRPSAVLCLGTSGR